jgi:hypothetical protein
MRTRNSIIVLTSICGFAISTLGAELPALRVKKAAVPPRLDGKLDDACWRLAARATDFGTPQQGPARVQTTAYLAYDDKNLYVAFRCDEPDPANIRAQAASEEDGFWDDDLVACFILPDGTSGLRYQFAITTKGLKFDQEKGLKGRGTENYSPSWEVATHIGEDAWSAEAVIPLEEIRVEPQMSKTWRMTFARHRSASERPGTSSWAPVGSNWHNRDAYGTVRGFMIGGKVLARKSVSLRDVDADEPRIGKNTCRLKLKNKSPEPQTARIAVQVHAPSGTKASFSRDVTLDARIEKEEAIEYTLAAQEGRHRLVFELSESGTATFVSPPLHVDVPSFLDTYLDRNYYTREDAARIHVHTRLREEALGELRLTFALKKGDKELETQEFADVTAELSHSIPLTDLETGDYTADIRLLDGKGNLLASSTEKLIKLPPSDREIKIDRERRIMLVNGEPRFVLWMYLPELDALKEVRDAGYNTVGWLWSGSRFEKGAESAANATKMAAEHGMGTLFSPPFLNTKFLGAVRRQPEEFKKLVPEFIESLRVLDDAPPILWYGFDEPGGPTELEVGSALYDAYKQANPYVPVVVVFARRVQLPIETMADIVCVDTYWDPGRNDVASIIPEVEGASRLAREMHLPFFNVFQANMWSGASQATTPREQRIQTYLALTKDVSGLSWFAWNNGIYAEMLEELKKLNREIHALAPILLTRTPPQKVTTDKTHSDIHLLLKQHAGKLYLVTANLSRQAADVTFELPAMRAASAVNVLFEDRKVQAKGSAFTDTFLGYGSHVYEIDPSGTEETYEIALSTRERAERWDPKDFFGRSAASVRNDVIDVRGPSNTLASVARNVNNPAIFSYDPVTRTAICNAAMTIAADSGLTIGDKDNPQLGETLKGLRDRLEVSGRLEIYNSRFVECSKIRTRYAAGRVIIRDSEFSHSTTAHSLFGAKRPRGTRVYDIKGADVHDCENYVFWLGTRGLGPLVDCRIHDNPKGLGPAGDREYTLVQKGGKPVPIVLVDCELWNNPIGVGVYGNAYGENDWIYVNTTDDNLDEYTFTLGSLTYKWHVTLTADDKAGNPLAGLNVWLDTEGEQHDEKGVTGEDGICRLDVAEYVRDKDGQRSHSYDVKIGTKGGKYRVIEENWTPTGNVEITHVE